MDERELARRYAEVDALSTVAIGRDLAEVKPMVELHLANENDVLRSELLAVALKVREPDEGDSKPWPAVLARLEARPGKRWHIGRPQ